MSVKMKLNLNILTKIRNRLLLSAYLDYGFVMAYINP